MSGKNWAEALVDFVDDGDSNRSRAQKFLASFCGSIIVHFSVIFAIIAVSPLFEDFVIILLICYSVFVSFVVSAIVSTGEKGGLIRRFWYGASLPMLCYFLALSLSYSFNKLQS